MRDASVEELAAVPGMTRPAARAVYNFFQAHEEFVKKDIETSGEET
jgi:hypothetical protein